MVRIDKIPQRLTCVLDDLIDYAFKSVSPVENGLRLLLREHHDLQLPQLKKYSIPTKYFYITNRF